MFMTGLTVAAELLHFPCKWKPTSSASSLLSVLIINSLHLAKHQNDMEANPLAETGPSALLS